MPEATGGPLPAPSSYAIFDDFSGGMSTKAQREGLPEKFASWLENLQPIAPNKLLAVPAPAASLAQLPGGEIVVSSFPAAIGTTDYVIYFCASGAAYAVTVVAGYQGQPASGGTVTVIAIAGTFSTSGGDCTVWEDQYVLFADAKSGYSAWDGTTFVRQGGVSPNLTVTAGGTGYTNPTVAITGGTGSGATATVKVIGGVVLSLTLTNPGHGYVAADLLTVTITDATGTGATAIGHVWPFLTPFPTTIAVAFGRVWLGAVRTLIITGTGGTTWGASFDDFRSSSGSVTTVLTDNDLIHAITALRNIDNYLYIVGDNSIKSIGSIAVVSSVTTFTITTLSSDQGTIYPLSIVSYNRLILFANTVGVYAVFGTSVEKISGEMDGLFRQIDFTLPLQAAVNDINNIHTYLLLVRYQDPLLSTRSLLLAFAEKRWYVIDQSTGLLSVVTVVLNGITETFGSSGADVTQLLESTMTPVPIKLETSLSPQGNPVRDKRFVRAGIAQTGVECSNLTLYADSEIGSTDTHLNHVFRPAQWINNSAQIVPWANNSNQVVQWAALSFTAPHSAEFSQHGRWIGATVVGSGRGLQLHAVFIEYQFGAPWEYAAAALCTTASGAPFAPLPSPSQPAPPPPPPTPSSQLWVVGSSCELLEFPLGATGNGAPTLNIQGLATQLTSLLANGDDKSFTFAVDFDTAGNQYAVGFKLISGGTGIQYFVTVYAPGVTGNVAPLRYIHGAATGFDALVIQAGNAGLCLDGSGVLYVGLFGKIYKFASGADGNAASTIFLDQSAAGWKITSLKFDAVRNWIWVTWFVGGGSSQGLNAYDLTGALQRAITDSTHFFEPWQVTLLTDGSPVVVDLPAASTQVFIYAPTANGASSPTRTITPPLPGGGNAPLGVAADTNNRIYVASGHPPSTLYVYATGASDALGSTPVQTIAGALTTFDNMLVGSSPPNAVTNIQQLNVR